MYQHCNIYISVLKNYHSLSTVLTESKEMRLNDFRNLSPDNLSIMNAK